MLDPFLGQWTLFEGGAGGLENGVGGDREHVVLLLELWDPLGECLGKVI